MRIERLQIENFLKIKSLDIGLTNVVNLFAGHNESGKTSLAEAVRIAILGDSPRVPLKKNYPQLVAHGSKKGAILVGTDQGDASRVLPSGKGQGTLDVLNDQLTYEVLLGSKEFTALPENTRRNYLFDICGVSYDTASILKRLAKRGVDPRQIGKVEALLAHADNFDAIAGKAKTTLAQLRGKWEGVTETKFGETKAKHFQVVLDEQPEEITDAAMEILLELADKAQANVAKTAQALGQMNAKDEQAENASLEIDVIAQAADDINKINVQLGAKKIIVGGAEAEIGQLERRVESLGRAANILSCPSCDTPLRLVGADLVVATQDELNTAAMGDETGKLKQEIAVHKQKLSATQNELDELRERKAKAEGAKEGIAALQKIIDDYTQEAHDKATIAAEEASTDRGITQHAVEIAERDVRLLAEAARTEEKAKTIFAEFEQWVIVRDAMSPTGIPAELLGDALETFNDKLKAAGEKAGWPSIRLDADMAFMRGDTPFALLSESAQWKANATIKYTIALMSEAKIMILDRMDVLDIPGRGQCIAWLGSIAKDFDTIFVFSTMKKAPKLPKSISVWWMDNGAIAA